MGTISLSIISVFAQVPLLYIHKDLCPYFKGVRSKTAHHQRGSLWLEAHHHRWCCAPAAVVSADTLSERRNTQPLMNLRPTWLKYTSYGSVSKPHNTILSKLKAETLTQHWWIFLTQFFYCDWSIVVFCKIFQNNDCCPEQRSITDLSAGKPVSCSCAHVLFSTDSLCKKIMSTQINISYPSIYLVSSHSHYCRINIADSEEIKCSWTRAVSSFSHYRIINKQDNAQSESLSNKPLWMIQDPSTY